MKTVVVCSKLKLLSLMLWADVETVHLQCFFYTQGVDISYTHTHVHTRAHMYTRTHTCTHTHACTHTHMHVHAHTCTHTHTHVYTYHTYLAMGHWRAAKIQKHVGAVLQRSYSYRVRPSSLSHSQFGSAMSVLLLACTSTIWIRPATWLQLMGPGIAIPVQWVIA